MFTPAASLRARVIRRKKHALRDAAVSTASYHHGRAMPRKSVPGSREKIENPMN
jgi:hypothetical protein